MVAPTAWRRRDAPAGARGFRVRQNPSCRYTVTHTVRSVPAAPQDASAYVGGLLPAQSTRHVLDAGARGSSAFRVVRQPGRGGRIRADALAGAVLTRHVLGTARARCDVLPGRAEPRLAGPPDWERPT